MRRGTHASAASQTEYYNVMSIHVLLLIYYDASAVTWGLHVLENLTSVGALLKIDDDGRLNVNVTSDAPVRRREAT